MTFPGSSGTDLGISVCLQWTDANEVHPRLLLLAQFDTMLRIHVKQSYGRATDRRQPAHFTVVKEKVIVPFVQARVEEQHNLPSLGINAAKVRPFVGIASVTGPRQSGGIVRFVKVLLGDDVLEVKREIGSRFLREQAILATALSSPPYETTQIIIHLDQDGRPRNAAPWPA